MIIFIKFWLYFVYIITIGLGLLISVGISWDIGVRRTFPGIIYNLLIYNLLILEIHIIKIITKYIIRRLNINFILETILNCNYHLLIILIWNMKSWLIDRLCRGLIDMWWRLIDRLWWCLIYRCSIIAKTIIFNLYNSFMKPFFC